MKIVETERLIVREIVADDDEFILKLLNDDGFIKYIGDRNVRNLEDAREYISTRFTKSYNDNGFGMNLVENKDHSRTPIGVCGFVKRDTLMDPDIGFAFLPEFCGKGYAFESANAMMKIGSEDLAMKRIVAISTQDNLGSMKLLEKLGFQFEKLIEVGDETLRLFGWNS